MPNYGGLHEDELARGEKMSGPDDIDLAFNAWFNQAQPLKAIWDSGGALAPSQAKLVKNQIKHAFTHGYARGVADHVAKPDPDDPELGSVR